MALPAQPNFLTLACRDVDRMAEFIRALGWPESPESEPAHRLFQCSNGMVVALYGATNYEPHFGPVPDGFRGFTLGINVATPEEVDAAYTAPSRSTAPSCSRSRSTRRTGSAASASAIPRATSGTSPGSAARRSRRTGG